MTNPATSWRPLATPPQRRIVDTLGLAWNKQLERLKRDPILAEGMTMTVLPSVGGPPCEGKAIMAPPSLKIGSLWMRSLCFLASMPSEADTPSGDVIDNMELHPAKPEARNLQRGCVV